jgi:UDP-glucose 4-epimerase
MKVLITGSAGYLGTVILNHLSASGYETVGLDLRERAEVPGTAGRFYRCDITDRPAIIRIFRDECPEVVIHFAGTTNRVRNRKKEHEIDIGGSRNLIEAARQIPSVRKFIYSSSAAIYGATRRNEQWLDESAPVNPGRYRYGINKKLTEEMLFSDNRKSDLRVISLRICTVVGPLYSRPHSVVSILMRLPVLPSSFRDTRVQFMHEEDFAELIARILKEKEMDGLFNLAPDSCTVVREVVPAGRFRRFPCRLLLPVMWLLWHLRIVNLQPAGLNYCLYPVVMDATRLAQMFDYHFRYTSSEAFLATLKRNRIPPGVKF